MRNQWNLCSLIEHYKHEFKKITPLVLCESWKSFMLSTRIIAYYLYLYHLSMTRLSMSSSYLLMVSDALLHINIQPKIISKLDGGNFQFSITCWGVKCFFRIRVFLALYDCVIVSLLGRISYISWVFSFISYILSSNRNDKHERIIRCKIQMWIENPENSSKHYTSIHKHCLVIWLNINRLKRYRTIWKFPQRVVQR